MSDVSGRVTLVTGAASGIGRATAELLASRGAVVHRADLEPTEGGLLLDVRKEEDWEEAVEAILGEHGRLDILVHSAGISAASPLAETTLEAWRRVLATNLDGSFLAVKHGLRAMTADGREEGDAGAIVLVGSASGIRPSAGAAAYSTSKAGVGMLVRAAAKECREAGLPVRINAVSPAGVKTPMWSTMPFFRDLVEEHGSEEAAFAALEEAGGDRFAGPGDIARIIAFLASDAAGEVNGAELPVDGGYTV